MPSWQFTLGHELIFNNFEVKIKSGNAKRIPTGESPSQELCAEAKVWVCADAKSGVYRFQTQGFPFSRVGKDCFIMKQF